jgi:diguanylate cyclase (GGDEF)-like protein
VTDPEISRLPAVLDAPLERLLDHRAELAKEWLLRVLERASLDAIERLPTDRIAQDLPNLISDIVEAVRSDPEAIGPDDAYRARANRIADLRGTDTVAPADLARDISALHAVLLEALRRELAEAPAAVVFDVTERLAAIFGAIQAAAIDELVRSRSEELEWLANTDALTGLFNLRYLQEHIRLLLGMQKRYGDPFAVLVLDIDGLKRINDAYGHAAGDSALMGVAEAIRASIRTIDIPVRVGGDEFCILAPHQSAAGAKILANRLAVAVERIEAPDNTKVGVSIGVVACPQHGSDAGRLLELADSAMYRAKASGEHVVVADVPAPEDVAQRSEQNG